MGPAESEVEMLLRGTIDHIVRELREAWACIRCGEIYRNGVQASPCRSSEEVMAVHEVITRQPVVDAP